MKHRNLWRGLFICIWLISFMPAQAAPDDTIIVNTISDNYDLPVHCSVANFEHLPGTDGVISLREALCVADYHTGADTIEFSIPSGCDPTSKVCTITPTSVLPALSQGGTVINGYTQDYAEPATSSSEASIKIEIDGSSAGSARGLNINSSGNLIQGLNIHSFSQYGIRLNGSGATENYILGNYIGTDPTGSLDKGNSYSGVMIDSGAKDNKIGDDNPAARNLISGNDNCGIRIRDVGTEDNKVLANYIGITAKGDAALGNSWSGVCIEQGAKSNQIGGDAASSRNIISGNGNSGVMIEGTFDDPDPLSTTLNIISGNYIGTSTDGQTGLGNAWDGINIRNYAPNNTVGGDTSGSGNLISGNGRNGVSISGSGSDGNIVSGNLIGTDVDGNTSLGNGWSGVFLYQVQNTTIGGDTVLERNVIAASTYQGVDIHGSDTSNNTVIGNYIGTDVSGTLDLGNLGEGIKIYDGSHNNIIGGSTSGHGNLISGNNGNGVVLTQEYTFYNTIEGNRIGTNASGTAALGNTKDGIYISSAAHDNTIGGDTPGAGNLISGNGYYGVRIIDLHTNSNTVAGNNIGVSIAGNNPIGNNNGIYIGIAARYNIIGGDTPAERNLISGNTGIGIHIDGNGTMSNTIIGNYIGVDASGLVDLGNQASGITIGGEATGNTIGGDNPAEANVISGNNQWGIWVLGSLTMENVIKGNLIGLGADGSTPLGNSQDGVYFSSSASDNTVGPNNWIAHNFDCGVQLSDESTDRNIITQNHIFSNVYGIIRSDGANNNIPAPTILNVAPNTSGGFDVTGTTCSACLVEVFANIMHDEQGKNFLASGSADGSGNFTVVVTPADLMLGHYLTATATDPGDGTSMFSGVYTHPWEFTFLPLVLSQ